MKILSDVRERKLIEIIPNLHSAVHAEFIKGTASQKITLAGDVRDYFLYQVVLCEGKEQASDIIDRYGEYLAYFEVEKKDMPFSSFYTGFFFGLIEVLRLKYEIGQGVLLNGKFVEEPVKFKDFEESWEITLKELGV